MTEITSGSNVQSTKSACYKNITWQRKAWHESTNRKEQKSFTDHEPKRIRRYNGTHVNKASSVNRFSKQDMAGTMIRRHVGELIPLTTKHYMA